jgi:hypothetical protein
MKRILWTKEEDKALVKIKDEDGCLWEEISDVLLPHGRGNSSTLLHKAWW